MSLKHIEGRVIVSADLDSKNWHSFANGTKIRLERQWNNFNRRHTEPVNAIVVSGENIKEGAEILVHPNALTETNKINNFKPLSGTEAADDVKYFSIPEDMCFAWYDGEEWKPFPGYDFALRIFKPYTGIMIGVDPEQIPDVLWVTTGDLKDKAIFTLKACDYCIIFQDVDGREGNLIRFRPNGDEKTKREPEAIAILHEMTKKVKDGNLLVGIEVSDAKSINEFERAI